MDGLAKHHYPWVLSGNPSMHEDVCHKTESRTRRILSCAKLWVLVWSFLPFHRQNLNPLLGVLTVDGPLVIAVQRGGRLLDRVVHWASLAPGEPSVKRKSQPLRPVVQLAVRSVFAQLAGFLLQPCLVGRLRLHAGEFADVKSASACALKAGGEAVCKVW